MTTSHGRTGVSLDPPYAHDRRSARLYREDDPELSSAVRAWAAENGGDPMLAITLAGKGDEHDELLGEGWTRHEWRADGETIWASPGCVADDMCVGELAVMHVPDVPLSAAEYARGDAS